MGRGLLAVFRDDSVFYYSLRTTLITAGTWNEWDDD
jgi:hypothetical protein